MELLGLADRSGGIAPSPSLLAAACGSKLQGGDSLFCTMLPGLVSSLQSIKGFGCVGSSVTTALALGIHGGAGAASPSVGSGAGEARSSPPPSPSISLEEAGRRCGLVAIPDVTLGAEEKPWTSLPPEFW